MPYLIRFIASAYQTLREAFHLPSDRQYSLAGIPNNFFVDETEKSKLVNALFMSHHDGQKGKGTHRLHNPVHKIRCCVSGRVCEIDKREKPEEQTLVQWLCSSYRMSHKVASQVAKRFGRDGN
jgi:hypothetical protein